MSVSDVLSLLEGSSGALAAVLIGFILLFTGKLHTDREFKKVEARADLAEKALTDERKATTEIAQSGSVTNQLIGALTSIATQRGPYQPQHTISAQVLPTETEPAQQPGEGS